jgi:DNA sulfur modification protein DndB
MDDNQKFKIIQNLVVGNDVDKELKIRKKYYTEESVKKNNETEINRLLGEGYEVSREYKTTVRYRKAKEHDVLFEDEVWSMLATMGFNTLNKNRNLEIPYLVDAEKFVHTQQVDVLAKDENTIIIVECKAAKKNTPNHSFKESLEAYQMKIPGIIKSLKQIFSDKKYKIKFIYATKNYGFTEKDNERLENFGGIHFDSSVVDYYNEMYKQINISSKYQFLGNLFSGEEILSMDNKVPAIKGKMGGHTYYSFSIEPEKILMIGYVLHRKKANINMMPTYQRIIKRKRRLDISHDINNNGAFFPNSIIISIDNKDKKDNKKPLRFDLSEKQIKSTRSRLGILHLPRKYKSAYIIDGQHRVYGYAESEYRLTNTIPVVAFENLDREEQVKLFVEINSKQKPVNKNLLNTLNADLLWTSKEESHKIEALGSKISIELGENRNSPLYDLIWIGEESRVLTIESIKQSLKDSNFYGVINKNKIEKIGTIYNQDLDDSYKRLYKLIYGSITYIKEFTEDKWNEENSFILTNNTIYGFIRIVSDIVDHLLEAKYINNTKNINEVLKESEKYLDIIIRYTNDLDPEKASVIRKQYGAGGKKVFWRNFQIAINSDLKEFNPDGLEDYLKRQEKKHNLEGFELIRDIELKFKSGFKNKLIERFGEKDWWKKGVPIKTYDAAEQKASKKNRDLEESEEVEGWDNINLIDYRIIAEFNWQYKDSESSKMVSFFKELITLPDDEKNTKKEDCTKWMEKIGKIRNEGFHQYYISEEELELLKYIKNIVFERFQ